MKALPFLRKMKKKDAVKSRIMNSQRPLLYYLLRTQRF